MSDTENSMINEASPKSGRTMRTLSSIRDWTDARLPIVAAWKKHMSEYYAPKNFNFWYFFGVLSLLVLVIQLITGIFLTMNYTPSAENAFASVEYIMRDVEYGWLLRYLHSTGASAFFIVVYLHMFRGLMYGSYKRPRELIWVIGMAIYLVLMAEGFMGYVLPWGQMSYWGANVIVSLFGAIPVIGEDLLGGTVVVAAFDCANERLYVHLRGARARAGRVGALKAPGGLLQRRLLAERCVLRVGEVV